jgi:UDP-glucose 4-epimerase
MPKTSDASPKSSRLKTGPILVTGGSGFIGTHLCRLLVQKGYEVQVLDRVGPKEAVAGVKYVRGDVRDQTQVRDAVENASAVYHFAAIVSVPICQDAPLESYQTNLVGSLQVLNSLREKQKKTGEKTPLFFAGSAAAYGMLGKEKESLSEDLLLEPPLSYYGAQKLGSEQAIRLFHEEASLPAMVFRFFNVYGPGQDPSSPYSGVISVFSRRIQEGQSLTLNSGGIQTRDFISVHDLVRACAAGLDLAEEKLKGQIVNLGTETTTTIRELALAMLKISGKTLPLLDGPARSGDVLYSRANIQKAKKELNWKPSVTLEEGLKELLNPRREK